MYERLTHRFFNVHDRAEELKKTTTPEVRDASHSLANATMRAESTNELVSRRTDALVALMRDMQGRRNES